MCNQNVKNGFVRAFTGDVIVHRQLNAWCEVCGTKNVYGNMLHNKENDIIYCNTESCRNCYLTTTKKETTMKTLEISGFKHVTTTGIARLFQELDSYGTIGMIYELTGEQMANMLMNTRHYSPDTYITVPKGSSEYDDTLIEIHDEIVDAYTMVTWGYSHIQDNIAINNRVISNLSSSLEIDVPRWEYKTVDINELKKHCANNTPVYVRLFAHEEGQSYQRFEWTIGEATEFHIFSTMYFAVKALYPNATIQLV